MNKVSVRLCEAFQCSSSVGESAAGAAEVVGSIPTGTNEASTLRLHGNGGGGGESCPRRSQSFQEPAKGE